MAISAIGMIRVIPNSQLVKMEQEAQEATAAAAERNKSPLLTGLAQHVTECWTEAKQAKDHVLPRLLRAHRALQGVYDPEKLGAIQEFGGSEEYARLTANKIRVVSSWLRDVFLGQTDKPWTLNPTPKPDFPPDIESQVRQNVAQSVARMFTQTGRMPDPVQVRAQMAAEMDQFEEALMEEARKTTARMERYMEDQQSEAAFEQVLDAFLLDLATYPTAIIKGPVLRRKSKLEWVPAGDSGDLEPKVEKDITLEWDRVDPFRFYPAPGAESPQDGYTIELHTFSHTELYDLIGAPGYDEEAIRAVLRKGETGGLRDWAGINRRGQELHEVPESLQRKVFEFDALEYNGPVLGKHLLEWGLEDDDIDDPEATYEACVWLVGDWVIKAQLNYDPLGQRGYYATSYERVPGEFWGSALPDILDDMQGIVNAAVRSLVNNMAMGSGPQVEVNIDRLAPGQDVSRVTPWQVIQTQDSQFGTQGPAVSFFQPNSNVPDLVAVIEKFYQFADDFSLVPRYMAGSDKVGGAGRTASGLSMLMEAANKGLKGVVANIDTHILTPLLTKQYNHNMLFATDRTIKGDAQVTARGAVSLMRLESLQLRRNEFLQVTANPLDSAITGPDGRAEVLRSVAQGLELNTDKVVPPSEQLQQRLSQEAAVMQARQGTQGQSAPVTSQEVLPNGGGAVTDNFSKNALTP